MNADADPPLLVACLCAAWCGTCRDYAATFEAVCDALGTPVARHWIDIEDDADLVDGIDVDDFPTLLVARAGRLLFFGPLTPQPPTLARLLAQARDGALPPPEGGPVLDALVRRLGSRPG